MWKIKGRRKKKIKGSTSKNRKKEILESPEIFNLSPTLQSQEEELYWEKDDINPNQVIYDLENNKTIIPTSDEELIGPPTDDN